MININNRFPPTTSHVITWCLLYNNSTSYFFFWTHQPVNADHLLILVNIIEADVTFEIQEE